MGNLLDLLFGSKAPTAGVTLDFESTSYFPLCIKIRFNRTGAQPTDAERATFDSTQKLLAKCQLILKDLESYAGAGDVIKDVIR